MSNLLVKRLSIIIAVMFTTYISAKDKQGIEPEYNILNPYKSKGLTRIKISIKKSLPSLLIAKNGKAMLPIVCQEEGYYIQVAKLLKEYLDKATGANFIITSKVPKKGKAIFIGNSSFPEVNKIFKKAQMMPDESFIIDSIKQGIVIVGKDAFCKNRLKNKSNLNIADRKQSRGTFFAMVDFLERLIGMRFYFPGIGIHIPNLQNAKVEIPSIFYIDTPVFDFRSLGYGGGLDFKLIKANRGDVVRWNLLSRLADVNMKQSWHTDSRWHEQFGKTHPEYFALRKDGTRAVGERGRFSSYRCYTCEAGFNAHIAAIGNYYKTGAGAKLLFASQNREFTPNKKYIHWGITDAFRGCYCEKCKKITDQNSEAGLYSKLVWGYVLKLAKECKKRWPDKILKIHVYGKYRKIPEFIKKENPGNLLICSVRIGPDGTSAAFLKENKAWTKAQKHLNALNALSIEKPYLWLHYPHAPRISNGQNMPYMLPHYYQKFMMLNKDKISGMFFNGHSTYSYAFSSFILYIMYKASWNPDIDVDACIDEYCKTLFGPAAEEVNKYYKTTIDRWENVKWKNLPNGCLDSKLPISNYWKATYPPKIRYQLEKLLLKALSKTTKGSIYYDRVKFLVDGIAPFFEQGRYFDLGKKYKLNCLNWTPKKIDGLFGNWYAAGVKALYLCRNDNGKREDKTLKAMIYMSHDDKNLYIAGRIDSKDSFITKGKKQKRDREIWAKDSLEIFLSTEQPGMKEAGLNQGGQYHQIIIDPNGSIWDGYKNSDMNIGINLNIDYKVINLKNRMFFEMAIPFSELKCVTPKEGSKWFVNFYWNRPRNGKHMSYSWAGVGGHHDSSRFGVVEFSNKKPKPRK